MDDQNAAFEQFATQVMIASSAMAANQQPAAGGMAGIASYADAPDYTQYNTGAYGQPGRRQPNTSSPLAARGGRRQRGSTYAARISMPPTDIKSNINTKDRSSSTFRPSTAAATGILPQRPYRPSTQSRRSEQVYAGRRSAATAFSRRSAAKSRGSTYSSTTDTTGLWSGEDIDDLDWDVDHAPRTPVTRFWRWFWIVVPMMISLIFTTAGVLYLVYGSHQMVSNLQIWRMCFFIAGLPVIWWICEAVTLGSVWLVERSKLFKMQNALYFAYAARVSKQKIFFFLFAGHRLRQFSLTKMTLCFILQRPLANVLRSALALGWWALVMTAWTTSQDSDIKQAFQIVLKIWACVTLFMTANLLKTLLAKLLSSKFNKESHIQKIQDSLVKEYHLHMLLQPRDRFGAAAAGIAEADGEEVPAGSFAFPAYNGKDAGEKTEIEAKMELNGGSIYINPTMGTSKEELLDSSEIRSSSVTAGVVAAGAVDLEAACNQAHHLQDPHNIYERSNATLSPEQEHKERPGSVGNQLGNIHRSSTQTQRSAANSLKHETAPLHRRHGNSSIVKKGPRVSRLVRIT